VAELAAMSCASVPSIDALNNQIDEIDAELEDVSMSEVKYHTDAV
jgi:hypothetical protein